MPTLETRNNSKWWYGRWRERGKTIVKNLDIEVEGERPSDRNPTGDRKYRQSRIAAEAKLNEIAGDVASRKRTEEIAQAIHVARTGHRLGTIPVAAIFEAWQAMPRRRTQLSPTYTAFAKGVFARFASFMQARHPEATEMCDVSHEMASAFLASERARGIKGRTYNAALSLMKGAFRHLRRQAGIADNPFDEIVSRDEDTVHRIPYTPDELRRILEAAKEDAFCRPLIIAGICTAMRRGDVCLLRWADVDMAQRFITVKTSKTGATVSIPMFPMLHDELEKLPRDGEHCFPEQAELYKSRPDSITEKLNVVFAAAGFAGDESDGCAGVITPQTQELTEQEMLQRGRDRLASCTKFIPKVRNLLPAIFERYMAGASLNDIAAEFGLSKGSASNYLKRIEDVTGFPVIRQSRPEAASKRQAKAAAKKRAAATRRGLRRVNRRGFHAFRSTWVTLALTAGVPVDLVRKVTGHTTVETVMIHYFQPGREDFRRAIQSAMPTLLTGGAPTRDERMLEIIEGMTAETWQHDREALKYLLSDG